jgi:hypothetical protein
MRTKTEIAEDAKRACPYAHYYQGHAPWVEGYIQAATAYERELERLREIVRRYETR